MPVMPSVPEELAEPVEYYPEAGPELAESGEEEMPDFQFADWDAGGRQYSRKHRRNKILKFIFFEGLALGVLIVSTKLEVADQFSENSFTLLYKVLMLVAAIALAVIPVAFFALPPRLPPTRR